MQLPAPAMAGKVTARLLLPRSAENQALNWPEAASTVQRKQLAQCHTWAAGGPGPEHLASSLSSARPASAVPSPVQEP